MTLLELLVKGLEKWPEGVKFIYQQPCGDCEGVKMKTYSIRKIRYSFDVKVLKLEIVAKNQAAAIITKEQWEAAKGVHTIPATMTFDDDASLLLKGIIEGPHRNFGESDEDYKKRITKAAKNGN
tara:strand:+ start:39 stop:410 length:372 start_codon:yes stop_codon:yes gene_type:complete